MGQPGEAAGGATVTARKKVQVLRRKAGEVGEVAEQKLRERGLTPAQLSESAAGPVETARDEVSKTTRRARKKLAKNAKGASKELGRSAKQARKDAKQAAEETKRSGKKAAESITAEIDMKTAKAQYKAAKAQQKAAKAQRKLDRKTGSGLKRWVWWLGAGIAATGAAVAARAQMTQKSLELDLAGSPAHAPIGTPKSNGSGAHARDGSAGKPNY